MQCDRGLLTGTEFAWVVEFLESSPPSVQRLAYSLIHEASSRRVDGGCAQRRVHAESFTGHHKPTSALQAAATAARLCCLGWNNLCNAETKLCLLQASSIALCSCGSLEDQGDMMDGIENVTVQDIFQCVQLGLAETHLKQGHYDASLQALRVVSSKITGLLLGMPNLTISWLSFCSLFSHQYRLSGVPELALAATEVALEASNQLPQALASCDLQKWLLSQHATCLLLLGNDGSACVSAEKLVQLEQPSSQSAAKSLRLVIRAACRKAAKQPSNEVSVALVERACAMYADEVRMATTSILESVYELGQHCLYSTGLQMLRKIREHNTDKSDGALEVQLTCLEMRLRAQMAQVNGHSSASIGRDCILPPISEAPCKQVQNELQRLLWNLAIQRLRASQPSAAVTWLDCIDIHGVLSGIHPVSAKAFCMWCAGQMQQARNCAEAKLCADPSDVRSFTVLLLAKADMGDSLELKDASWRAMLHEVSYIALSAVCRAANAHSPAVSLSYLEAVADAIKGSVPIRECHSDSEAVLCGFLRLADHICSTGCRTAGKSILTQVFETVESICPKQHAAHTLSRKGQRLVFEFMWNQGMKLGHDAQWGLSAEAFKHAYMILASSGGLNTLHGAEACQMALVVHVAGLLEAARCRRHGCTFSGEEGTNDFQYVVKACTTARPVCETVAQLRQQSTQTITGVDRALPMIVLMEF